MPEPVADRPASSSPPPRTSAVAPASARLALWAWIALLLIAAAITAAWLDARNGQRELRGELAKRLAEIDAAQQATRAIVKDAQENLRDAQAKIALLENRLGESQTQQAALEALYRELSPSRDEWALTEVEQVLMLASQQLQLAGNVRSALAALQVADTKLQRLDRPQFVPLRRALARDMDRLKGVPYVDVAGLSLRLDEAIAQIDALPLARDERLDAAPVLAPPQGEAGWRRFIRSAWQEIRQLVRIEHADRPEVPLLLPQEQFFLRENLKLRLLSARFALLFRDQANFRADLAAADAWLSKYFDTRSKPVQALQTLLKQLKATDMATELPGLAASLDAVRVLQIARDKPQR
ncbi:MAG: uroporphyrinogen-III C-methyltransferase [Betaproteobacteria bacterium]